jgi:hypothetical protein
VLMRGCGCGGAWVARVCLGIVGHSLVLYKHLIS